MKQKAFTLAELLIALAILGIIATFTIPKILNVQTDAKYNAMAKEFAAALSSAMDQAKLDGKLTGTMSAKDLQPYLNYVSIDSVGAIDYHQGQTTLPCSGSYACLTMHNGAKILLHSCTFGTVDNTHVIAALFDADGQVSASTTGPSKGLWFFISGDSRIIDWDNLRPGSQFCGVGYGPSPGHNPSWFSWS